MFKAAPNSSPPSPSPPPSPPSSSSGGTSHGSFIETEEFKKILFFYENVQRVYDFDHSHRSTIETLQGQLIGWSGLIISIIFAGGGALFNKVNGAITINVYEFAILMVSLSCLLFAIIIGILNINTPFRRKYEIVPDPVRLIEDSKKQAGYHATIIKHIFDMSKAHYNNIDLNLIRTRLRLISSYFFLFGLFFAVIFISIQLYRYVR